LHLRAGANPSRQATTDALHPASVIEDRRHARYTVLRSSGVFVAQYPSSMQVRIASVGVAHPEHRISQADAARRIGLQAGDARRVAALARGTCIDQRAIALAPDAIECLTSSGMRNDIYRKLAPALALEAARKVLRDEAAADIACLVTSSCTGYSSPSWGVGLVRDCALPSTTMRLPITEAGCAGGAVALARAADHLRAHGGGDALAVSVELCSLAFHRGGDVGNITSGLIFGDGAGAALLQTGAGPGLEVLASSSRLIPDSEHLLGFDLTDQGFYPVLSQDLVDALPGPCEAAIDALLAGRGLQRRDIAAWLLHPGGARILRKLEAAMCIDPAQTRWSWASLREVGNTSSAAVFDVLRRYMPDARSGDYAVLAAFGPGVSIELLLLRAS
jgi:alkylresorcinol/alkylpyrone synthase